ncbi:MAG: 4Fe-4S binding protein [Desulfobulbaceae bacterium]|nr:4Fe-4S binding protein [Desulfobulbaceae bacterium]
MERIRLWVQALWFFLTNGYWAFPFSKNIYQGPLKVICSPGLNCYSCPASTTFCALGSLQNLLAAIRFNFQTGQYYFGSFVLGTIGLLGIVFGRFICGWGCPFGLIQDLLAKIPTKKFKVPSFLLPGKYLFLALFVIILPLVVTDDMGMGRVWFCKYVCPAGTLEAGIPMMLLKPQLRDIIGILFWSKVAILTFFLGWSIASVRPFCKTTCPLGAFYSMFSRYQLIKMKLNKKLCTNCKACHEVCPMDIRFNEQPNNLECINCLRCMNEGCTFGAISIEVAGYPIPSGAIRKKETTY